MMEHIINLVNLTFYPSSEETYQVYVVGQNARGMFAKYSLTASLDEITRWLAGPFKIKVTISNTTHSYTIRDGQGIILWEADSFEVLGKGVEIPNADAGERMNFLRLLAFAEEDETEAFEFVDAIDEE